MSNLKTIGNRVISNIKKISKKTWIEIGIAAVLVIAELIWALIYRFGGYAGMRRYHFLTYTMIYVDEFMFRLLYMFLTVNLMYVVVVLAVNSKSDKNTKILEIVGIVLIVVMEIAVLYVIRKSTDSHLSSPKSYVEEMTYLYVIFCQINALYAIVLQIAHSGKYKLCKIGVGVALPLIEFIIIWYLKYTSWAAQKEVFGLCLERLAIFANVLVIYLVALMVIDSFGRKPARQKTEAVQNTEVENPIPDTALSDESDN